MSKRDSWNLFRAALEPKVQALLRARNAAEFRRRASDLAQDGLNFLEGNLSDIVGVIKRPDEMKQLIELLAGPRWGWRKLIRAMQIPLGRVHKHRKRRAISKETAKKFIEREFPDEQSMVRLRENERRAILAETSKERRGVARDGIFFADESAGHIIRQLDDRKLDPTMGTLIAKKYREQRRRQTRDATEKRHE